MTPDPLNPFPVTPTDEIVMFEFPVFVSVTFCDVLVPTATVPNVRFDGDTLSEYVAAPPVPDNEIAVGEVGALLTTEIEPVTLELLAGLNTALNVADPPAGIVTGAVNPVVLNPLPVTENCEIVRLAFPGFEITTGCEFVLPVVTVPKLTLAGFAAICACVPVPLKATLNVGSAPLLVAATAMLPLALFVFVGVNCAVNVVLCPALRLTGSVIPVTLNPVPLALTPVTLSLAVPEFVTVTTCFAVVPTATPPNETVAGLMVKAAVPAADPCPASPTVTCEAAASLNSVIAPEEAAVEVGLNTALNVLDPPAGIVSGVVNPVVLKPVPLTANCDTVRLALPAFEIVIACELLVPVVTLPKSTLPGFTAICACVPVPLKATLIVGLELLLVAPIEMLPVEPLVAAGANCAVNVVLCPAPRLTGSEIPLTLKPAPAALTVVRFSFAVPEFVTVTTCFAVPPTCTFPNEIALGFADSPATLAFAPFPVTCMFVGEFLALLTIENVPAVSPVVFGAN